MAETRIPGRVIKDGSLPSSVVNPMDPPNDNTKLPLAGGTMSGSIYAVGHTMTAGVFIGNGSGLTGVFPLGATPGAALMINAFGFPEWTINFDDPAPVDLNLPGPDIDGN